MRTRPTSLVAYIATVHGLIHTIEMTYDALLSRIDDTFGAGPFVGIVANVLTIAFGLAAVAALLVATSPNTATLARWGTDAVYQALAGFVLLTLTLSITIWRLSERSHGEAPPHRETPATSWDGE